MVANQRVAVVTGASRGIGAAVVKAFRERGYSVVANSRSIKPSTEDGLIAVAGDIGDRAVARAIIDQGVARFGRIDTLVNNAGIFIGKPFTQYTPEDYASVLSTNMSGFFHVSQYAIAEMEKRNAGHVVNITANVLTAIAEVPAVLALLTKGGIDAATRGLAIEYARRGSVSTQSRPASSGRRCTFQGSMPSWAHCTRSAAWAKSRTSWTRCSTSRSRAS